MEDIQRWASGQVAELRPVQLATQQLPQLCQLRAHIDLLGVEEPLDLEPVSRSDEQGRDDVGVDVGGDLPSVLLLPDVGCDVGPQLPVTIGEEGPGGAVDRGALGRHGDEEPNEARFYRVVLDDGDEACGGDRVAAVLVVELLVAQVPSPQNLSEQLFLAAEVVEQPGLAPVSGAIDRHRGDAASGERAGELDERPRDLGSLAPESVVQNGGGERAGAVGHVRRAAQRQSADGELDRSG